MSKGKQGGKKTEIGWPRNSKGRARYQGPRVVNGETERVRTSPANVFLHKSLPPSLGGGLVA